MFPLQHIVGELKQIHTKNGDALFQKDFLKKKRKQNEKETNQETNQETK